MTVLVSVAEPGFTQTCYRTSDRRFRVMRRALIDGWVILDTSGTRPFEHCTLPGIPADSTYTDTLDEARTVIVRARAVDNRRRGYAAKWLVEHDLTEQDPDHAYPTDVALDACFANCVRQPPPHEYHYIRDAIETRRTELQQEGILP